MEGGALRGRPLSAEAKIFKAKMLTTAGLAFSTTGAMEGRATNFLGAAGFVSVGRTGLEGRGFSEVWAHRPLGATQRAKTAKAKRMIRKVFAMFASFGRPKPPSRPNDFFLNRRLF
jgi:hypothetical protein